MMASGRWRFCRKLAAFCAAGFLACSAVFLCVLYWSEKPPLLDDMSFSRIVLDKRGGILKISLSQDQKYRLRANLDEISPEASRAAIFYEDRHFYSHPGINPASFLRVLASKLAGARRMPGASTITMQVARLRYNLKTTTVAGKLMQMWLALKLERHYSKREILEAYFNLAPYGGNIEGIEAAARIYFNKPAASLTALECHALAVVPQNPKSRHPVYGKEFDKARARLEKILGASAVSEKNIPLRARKVGDLQFPAPHLSLEMLAASSPAAGKIHTGIERDLQLMLENGLKSYVKRGARYGIKNASAIIVECDSMNVVALAGSADFFDSAISGQVDGTRARRSPGSTLKPFIYGLAIDQGLIHPLTILADSPRSFGGYDPENFDRGFRGPIAAHEALKASRNLPAISLSERLSPPGLYGFLKNANIELPHEARYYGLALALGGAEISMRELVQLYAMLANQGVWRKLRISSGRREEPPRRLLSPEAAWLTMWMLKRGEDDEDGNLIYKTGTSNGFRDAWTAGIAGKYAIVVWVGNFDNQANPYFVGAKIALPLYREIVGSLGARRKLQQFADTPPAGLNLEQTRICASTGDMDIGHCGRVADSWHIPGVTARRDSGILRPVLIDKASGLRACQPEAGKTEEIWMEFWPGDMLKIFADAGIYKPQPPEWLPECAGEKPVPAAKSPAIVLPKKNVVYQRKIGGADFRLPLMATADSEAKKIHWYAGAGYIGSSLPGEIIFWNNPSGNHVEILAVDDRGRSSKRKCVVEALP